MQNNNSFWCTREEYYYYCYRYVNRTLKCKCNHVLLYIVPATAVTVSTSTDGTAYSITCTVKKLIALIATPDIVWVIPSGNEVTSGQVNSTQNGSTIILSVTVQLDPLLVSHHGLYTCKVSVLSPSLLAPLNFTSTATVSIQSKFKVHHDLL